VGPSTSVRRARGVAGDLNADPTCTVPALACPPVLGGELRASQPSNLLSASLDPVKLDAVSTVRLCKENLSLLSGVSMQQNVDQVLQAALSLPDEDQLRLVSALAAAVEERGLRPFDESWLGEIQRRSAEYDEGSVQAISWSDVKARARRQVSNGD
jgi:putative addiction module component (TIGR02574 family)